MSLDSTALSSDAQQLFEAAMKLPEGERAKLVDKLALTVDLMPDPEWRAAWDPEIARRVAEVEHGTAKLHTWDELQQMMRGAGKVRENLAATSLWHVPPKGAGRGRDNDVD